MSDLQWLDALAQSIIDLEGTSPNYLISNPWREPTNKPCCVVDLGGSTLRIAKVHNFKVDYIHTELVGNDARENPLGWLAHKVSEFGLLDFVVCWAFPLRNGNLCPMGKGWKLSPNDVNKPLAHRLNSFLGGRSKCLAAIHDATASLVAQYAVDPHCEIALTWGTGINIAFKKGPRVINSEIGMAGSPPYGLAIPRESWDEKLLQEVPGNMPLEYITGGAYLGRLYSIATGTETQTNELWSRLGTDSVADAIVDRACRYIAIAIHAVACSLAKTSCTVAYTGGVIFEPVVFDRLCHETQSLSKDTRIEIKLIPQRHGPEIGAALQS